ncbi:MAG: hypothetical protein M1827_006874 [Pycnora praestabilis]|nr:MAG: hypothetical protein M1827_006874 [Pycnora praestabilis]
MTWRGLRVRRRSEDVDRRHSTLDPSQNGRRSEQLLRNEASANIPPIDLESSQSVSSSTLPKTSQATHDESGRPSVSERPTSPAIQQQQQTPKHQRFNLLRFRNASDSQLFTRAKQQAANQESIPPVPKVTPTPAIITTAPTMDLLGRPQKRKPKLKLAGFQRDPEMQSSQPAPVRKSTNLSRAQPAVPYEPVGLRGSINGSRVTFDEPERPASTLVPGAPPAYGEDTGSSLALPISRLSESSRSDGSSGDHVAYASTTTTHTVSTTTTFFRLPRRKKNRASLFPVPMKIPLPDQSLPSASTPRASTSATTPESPERSPVAGYTPVTALRRPYHDGRTDYGLPSPLPSPSHVALAATAMNFAAPGTPVFRQNSTNSVRSASSSPSLAPPKRLGRRGRSSTMGSLNQLSDDAPLPTPPLPQSGRTSTSTTGRSSLGGLFSLSHRLRQNSEPMFPRHGSPGTAVPGTPGSNRSKSNSFSQSREAFVLPERAEDENPAKYLERLEEAVSRGAVASILSRSSDTFSHAVLRSYMRKFSFFGDPMDMAIRKLLMEAELPKETQQIDRVLQGFADRYHECNPGIYASPDQAYFIAFSILILHTDVFNKNNKHKMQRNDYIKNTQGEGISDAILECFYDNISYTPFIHVEDDVDIHGERILGNKTRNKLFKGGNADPLKKASREPVDPYTLILDSKLDVLRPTLKDVMNLDDPYNYLGTADTLDLVDLHKTFFKSGVLQIVSARSRPDAFKSPSTTNNPEEAHPGVVDIKITKVGTLWRKDVKKKKARSPWQEWGAILTGSQLYFFRNTAWAKNLIQQYDMHHKHGHAGIPVIFKPPLETFKPDAMMSTDDSVALVDASYKKHKNAFTFVRHGGFEETFLADNESEMNDWLAKLNYAATFRTAGVRMRGLVGTQYEGHRRGIMRMNTSSSARSDLTATEEAAVQYGKGDMQLAQQILVARRQIMSQKIGEAEEKLATLSKQLESQLRNARHLQILAPIQPKSREQIIMAAGRMAAKLKWVRMEIWRLKCHKDVLMMDLEEEKTSAGFAQLNTQTMPNATSPSISTTNPQRNTFGRLDSKTSTIVSPQRSPRSPMVSRPTTHSSSIEKDYDMDDIFQASPDISRQSSYQKAQSPWELPPISFETQETAREARRSISSAAIGSPSQHSLGHQSSMKSVAGGKGPHHVMESATRLATPTPSIGDREKEILKEAGLVGPEGLHKDEKRPGTASDSEMDKVRVQSPEGEGSESRSKVRRSLHRTLREAHVPTHHRSKKGKDSSSSAAITEDGSIQPESEGLARGTGSFTVHGKKASVITFGSEWQTMSPEERLKLRKQAQSEDAKLLAPTAIEDEDEIATSSPRRVSATSASTTTARSANEEESSTPLKSRGYVVSSQTSPKSETKKITSSAGTLPQAVDSPREVVSRHENDALSSDDEKYELAREDARINSPTQPQSVSA